MSDNCSPVQPASPPPDLYSSASVRALFNEMARTYGLVNLLSSFGFCWIWRRQCVGQLSYADGMVVYDLMAGMGECCRPINHYQHELRVVAVDFSTAMCDRSRRVQSAYLRLEVSVLEEDILGNTIPAESADRIVSTFGLKTFADDQGGRLAAEVARILKPGGSFSLLEISVPPSRALRVLFLFYLNRLIPLIGRALMGNPDNYRLLGVYTAGFGTCARFAARLREAGLTVEERSYFFGCATGLVGRKGTEASLPGETAV